MPERRRRERAEMAATPHRCQLCGEILEEGKALGHLLVAHGPLQDVSIGRKRKRARAKLPQVHRRLEEAGFSEAQAHLIVRVVSEELRKAGIL